MLLVGYMIAEWGSYGFLFYRPKANNQWRPMLALQCAPVTFLILIMPWMPESPRWLVKQDCIADAERILLKLHEPEEAAIELSQIKEQVTVERELKSDWHSMLWKKPSYRKRSAIGFGTTAFIQFSGILVINSELLVPLSLLRMS
jgi:hypothetical protein